LEKRKKLYAENELKDSGYQDKSWWRKKRRGRSSRDMADKREARITNWARVKELNQGLDRRRREPGLFLDAGYAGTEEEELRIRQMCASSRQREAMGERGDQRCGLSC
jgi:hypothetical protein